MNVVFEYAAKAIQGRSSGEVVAPGEYWTAVNVYNPTDRTTWVTAKVAVGLPRCESGPVARICKAELKPDHALEVDRNDVFEALGSDEFVKGFVVVRSPVELEVVSVYTAERGEGVETLDIERVPARRMEVGLPDLVPEPDDTGSFCRRDDEGNLIVTVRNQGNAGAGASTTTVDYGSHGNISLPTPALAAGASVDLAFPIPPSCFDPDCEFRIRVDDGNVVVESDETNNIASGICLG